MTALSPAGGKQLLYLAFLKKGRKVQKKCNYLQQDVNQKNCPTNNSVSLQCIWLAGSAIDNQDKLNNIRGYIHFRRDQLDPDALSIMPRFVPTEVNTCTLVHV